MTFTDRAKAQIRKALPDMEALRAKARETAAFIPTEWVTMTEATEALWGTSGRGNPSCVKLIEACAALGMVEIREKDARTRMVRRAMPRLSRSTSACGRTLTVPSSIEAGIGPECASRA